MMQDALSNYRNQPIQLSGVNQIRQKNRTGAKVQELVQLVQIEKAGHGFYFEECGRVNS
jgi:hypothetical protein